MPKKAKQQKTTLFGKTHINEGWSSGGGGGVIQMILEGGVMVGCIKLYCQLVVEIKSCVFYKFFDLFTLRSPIR